MNIDLPNKPSIEYTKDDLESMRLVIYARSKFTDNDTVGAEYLDSVKVGFITMCSTYKLAQTTLNIKMLGYYKGLNEYPSNLVKDVTNLKILLDSHAKDFFEWHTLNIFSDQNSELSKEYALSQSEHLSAIENVLKKYYP